jgi:predicted glycosyltransferase
MVILIDIIHPAHLNLFKGLIFNLNEKGHKVIVTCIKRGKLPIVVEKELYPLPVNYIGKHKGTMFSIIFEANILRFFQLFHFMIGKKIDIGISFGSFIMGAGLTLLGKPNIHFGDDPERKMNAFLELLTCTERYLPAFVNPSGKTKVFNALKEWAYLSPDYFTPNQDVLKVYNIRPKEYLFIREVSTGSLNYLGQEVGIISTFASKLPKKYKVILSLEDKTLLPLYPSDWIILKEPVDDIHSLIYYSKVVISSGDSMAREGAMLGNPAVYCGSRFMKANQLLIDKNILFKVNPEAVPKFVENLIYDNFDLAKQNAFRNKLMSEWIDVNKFLLCLILKNR